MSTHLQDEWSRFRALILDPINASPIQVTETRRAFWAGAAAMLDISLRLAELSEDAAAQELEGVSREIMQFSRAVKDGIK